MAQRKVLEWDGGTRMGWRDYSGLERLKWDGGIRVGWRAVVRLMNESEMNES